MKVYLLKAFDKPNFHLFTPSVAGFTKKETADAFCELNNNINGSVLFAYNEIEISELSAKEFNKVLKMLTG